MQHYTIGQLSKLTGQTTVTIRYYEKLKLLGNITRSSGGFRQYPDNLIARFSFIKNAKAVGFNLADIKTLFDLQTAKAPSQQVKLRTQKKIADINDKIKTLKRMQRALSKWEKACDGEVPIDECPILINLYQPSKD
tara:strand:- start:2246 stop:2653 length:408 start_codon:yes stop_codon:yes gene_type:complete